LVVYQLSCAVYTRALQNHGGGDCADSDIFSSDFIFMQIAQKKCLFTLAGTGIAGVLALFIAFAYLRPDVLCIVVKKPSIGTCSIIYPHDATVFPPEIPPPSFRWRDTSSTRKWLVTCRFIDNGYRVNAVTDHQVWEPSEKLWENIKKNSRKNKAILTISGFKGTIFKNITSSGEISFTTSEDSVGNPLFYREVILPFSEAVKDPSKIRWRFGSIQSRQSPPVVLENLPVCGNCHSFSTDGKMLGMDVDYANDKGSYAMTNVERNISLSNDNIITWSDFRRDENDPTFGLLSQISPDGRFVVSTVKDRSVFVAKPDLAFSQLFFPIQGTLAVYSRETGTFTALPGADDPQLVQSNPSWSPDGKYIVFARCAVYHLKNLHDKAKAYLSPDECSEFLNNQTLFKYDLYRVPFNDGKGGVAESLMGASGDGSSNYFARYSPDGKWIIFCKSNSFMLLQPDSRLYIIPSGGGTPRLMKCNTNRMNSWHSWSSNSRWLVFASKENTPYTQLYITHIDTNGNDAPAVLLEHLVASDRAANIPEFVYTGNDAIKTIREQFIDDVSLWRSGMSFEEAGDDDNAYKRYLQALKLNSKNVRAHISAGNVLERRKMIDDALAHYTQAVQLDSTFAIAHVNMGNIFFNKGDLSEAIQQYRTALRFEPNNGFTHCNLAEACLKCSQYSEAREHFLIAKELMPDDALTRFGLGKTYMKMNNIEGSIDQFTEGVRLLPDDPDGYQLLCDALVKTQRRDNAIKVYRKALQILPDNPELQISLANLLRTPDERPEALRLYNKVLMIKPDLKEVMDSIAVLRMGK
jgi:tetratricopeptide (TPR) repeat protein